MIPTCWQVDSDAHWDGTYRKMYSLRSAFRAWFRAHYYSFYLPMQDGINIAIDLHLPVYLSFPLFLLFLLGTK